MFSAPRCKEPSLVHSGKPLRGGRTFRKMFQDWEAWDEQAQENWKSKYFRKGKPWWLPFCQQREQADFQRQAWEQTRHCSFHIIERRVKTIYSFLLSASFLHCRSWWKLKGGECTIWKLMNLLQNLKRTEKKSLWNLGLAGIPRGCS